MLPPLLPPYHRSAAPIASVPLLHPAYPGAPCRWCHRHAYTSRLAELAHKYGLVMRAMIMFHADNAT